MTGLTVDDTPGKGKTITITTKVVARILTRRGDIAAEVREVSTNGRVHWRWSGKWGAGCGDPGTVRKMLERSMRARRHWTMDVPFPPE